MAFFDAVLAIAMTMLALEITVPQISKISSADRYSFFVEITCYFISFTAMSTLWYVHNYFFSSHDLTENNIEIVLHLVLLFFITLFQPLTRATGLHPDDVWIRAMYLTDFFVMYIIMALIIVSIRKKEEHISDTRKIAREAVKKRSEKLKQERTVKPSHKDAVASADGQNSSESQLHGSKKESRISGSAADKGTQERRISDSAADEGTQENRISEGTGNGDTLESSSREKGEWGEKNSEMKEEMSEGEKELRHLMHIVWAIEDPELVQKKLVKYMPDEYREELENLRIKRQKSYRMALVSVAVMAAAVLCAVVTLIFSVLWSYVFLAAGLLTIFLMRFFERN